MAVFETEAPAGNRHPIWWVETRRDTATITAHLIRGTSNLASDYAGRMLFAWCGRDVSSGGKADGYAKRCSRCIFKLEEYSVSATAPQPERVVETVVFRIERDAEGMSVVSSLGKYIDKRPNWEVVDLSSEIEPVSPER